MVIATIHQFSDEIKKSSSYLPKAGLGLVSYRYYIDKLMITESLVTMFQTQRDYIKKFAYLCAAARLIPY